DPVLGRQLRRTLELPNDGALGAWLNALLDGDRASRAQQVDALRMLLRLVDDSYVQHRRDAALRTRSLMLSSEELIVANERLPAELEPLLRDALEPLEPRAHEKGVALTLELDGALPPEGLGDPMRLRQVLVNLVGNAVKFTREGSIRVRAQPRRTAGERRLHL